MLNQKYFTIVSNNNNLLKHLDNTIVPDSIESIKLINQDNLCGIFYECLKHDTNIIELISDDIITESNLPEIVYINNIETNIYFGNHYSITDMIFYKKYIIEPNMNHIDKLIKFACRSNFMELIKYLYDLDIDFNNSEYLELVAINNDLDSMRYFIDIGCTKFLPAINEVIAHDYEEMTILLCENFPDLSCQINQIFGSTICCQNINIIQYLLDMGYLLVSIFFIFLYIYPYFIMNLTLYKNNCLSFLNLFNEIYLKIS